MAFIQRIGLLLITLLFFSPLAVQAMSVPKGVTILTAPEVRAKVDNKQALLIHTLSRIEYEIQHIPHSFNVPVDEIAHSSQMPTDKNTAIIFYCNGRACPYSRRAAKTAVEEGYTQVYWFREGILGWRQYQYEMVVNKALSTIKVAKLSPDKFHQRQQQEDMLVLDVRPHWWRQSKEMAGVIQGTDIMIPLLRLDSSLHQLPKDRPILIVDRLMRQSSHAAKFLILNGFNIQGILKGGSKRWASEGRPILDENSEPNFASDI
jgi:rhodanese-related sulfurtransferase